MVARKGHSLTWIAVLLALAVALAACGSSPQGGEQAGASQAPAAAAPATAPAAEAPAAPAAGSEPPATGETDKDPRDGVLKPEPIPAGMFPLTQDKVTIRVAIPGNASVEDFNTNAFTAMVRAADQCPY